MSVRESAPTPQRAAERLRVLAVSHACVVDVNQRLFADLGSRFGLEIGLVAPRRWRSDLRGDVAFTALPDFRGRLFLLSPAFRGRGRLHFYLGAGAAVRAFKPDIVHLDEEPWSLAAWQFAECGARAGAKVIFYTKENISKNYPIPFPAIERRVYALAACGVALTDEAAEVLRRRGFSRPIFVIPHAVDREQFTLRDAAKLRQRLGFGGTVVGYVGRLAPEKGVMDFLDAISRLADRGVNSFSVVVVGSGPLEAEVRARAADPRLKERVRIMPPFAHDEVGPLYNCLDILVLPSRTTPRWKEQFGRVLIEALASGCAVIGSDSGEIPHLIQATGGGIVFPEGSVDALADAIKSLVEDPGKRSIHASRGRAAVAKHYASDTVAHQFYRVYSSLISSDAS